MTITRVQINHIAGSLDIISQTVEQAGLRAVLCYEVTDRDGMEKAQAGIAENVRFIEASRTHPLIRGTFGLHASLTLNDEVLRACADAHSGGFHVHVAEHEADEEDSLKRSGQPVVPRLDAFGIWNDKTIAAHCVHIDEHERDMLHAKGVWISHQPRSNMNNAVGALAFDTFLQRGLKVCLGNDGFSNNMWAEWKDAYLLHKVANRDPRKAGGYDIVKKRQRCTIMLVVVELFFSEKRIGQLTSGAQADMIFVDYHPYTPLTTDNLPGTFCLDLMRLW